MNEKIKLITDSTCDISKDLIEELDLEVIPLCVSFDDENKQYFDGVNITLEDIEEHVNKTGTLPSTSAIGPGTYIETFNKWIEQGYSIIATGIGSKLSANYKSLLIAQKECVDESKVTIIDSNNLSSATGILLLHIRDMINEGMSREEIKNKCEKDIVPNIHCSFCIDKPDYLVKGGRCSSFAGFICKLLAIKPIIVVKDGKLTLGKKPIGTLTTAINTIYQSMVKELDKIDSKYLMITHVKSDIAANFIKPLCEKLNKFKNIYNTYAGCVISSHCGRGTIGLLYLKKN